MRSINAEMRIIYEEKCNMFHSGGLYSGNGIL